MGTANYFCVAVFFALQFFCVAVFFALQFFLRCSFFCVVPLAGGGEGVAGKSLEIKFLAGTANAK